MLRRYIVLEQEIRDQVRSLSVYVLLTNYVAAAQHMIKQSSRREANWYEFIRSLHIHLYVYSGWTRLSFLPTGKS